MYIHFSLYRCICRVWRWARGGEGALATARHIATTKPKRLFHFFSFSIFFNFSRISAAASRPKVELRQNCKFKMSQFARLAAAATREKQQKLKTETGSQIGKKKRKSTNCMTQKNAKLDQKDGVRSIRIITLSSPLQPACGLIRFRIHAGISFSPAKALGGLHGSGT